MTRINIEDKLRVALRRQHAPEGFDDRILACVTRESPVPRTASRDPWFRRRTQPLMRWAALATVSVAMIVGSVHYRNVRRERAQGEAAKQRLMLALRIAGSKLQLAKSKVIQINADQAYTREEKE